MPPMTRLNQIIAIEKDTKTATMSAMRGLHDAMRRTQDEGPWNGTTSTYAPLTEDGERLPPKVSRVQTRASDIIDRVTAALTSLFDVVATKDWANQRAAADVVVDGIPLLTDVPVTYLLFLEKQLGEIQDFISAMPTLDPSETWAHNSAAGCYASAPQETARTKKILRNHELSPVTQFQPAQVQVYHEDQIVGTWTKTKFSGALPMDEVTEMLARVTALKQAVQCAREEANVITVDNKKIGKIVLGYVFSG